MGISSESDTANPNTDNTRAGGPDDSREIDGRKEIPKTEPDNTPRGAPEESRSIMR